LKISVLVDFPLEGDTGQLLFIEKAFKIGAKLILENGANHLMVSEFKKSSLANFGSLIGKSELLSIILDEVHSE